MHSFFTMSACTCHETRNIQLTGAALEALRDYDATVSSLTELLKQAQQKFVGALNREFSLELDVEDVAVDREYLGEFGFAVLKVPVAQEQSQPQDTPQFETIGSNSADPESVAA